MYIRFRLSIQLVGSRIQQLRNYLKALTTLLRVRRRMLFLRSSWLPPLLLLAVFPLPPTELEFTSGSGYRGCSPESDLLSSALRLLDSLRQRRRMEISVGDGRFGCAGWELRPWAKVIVVVAEADVVDVLDGQVTMVVEPPEEVTASFGLWP